MAGIDGAGDAPAARLPEFDGGTRELREVGGRREGEGELDAI